MDGAAHRNCVQIKHNSTRVVFFIHCSFLPKAVCEQRSYSECRMRLLPLFAGRNDKMPYLFLENKKRYGVVRLLL